MGFTQTIVFYLLVGMSVSLAVFLKDNSSSKATRLFQAVTSCLFWPLYLPILLSSQDGSALVSKDGPIEKVPVDSMASAIDQVESELESAVSSLDGWAEDVLAHEQSRFSELCSAWRVQAEKIRELDRLLMKPDFLTQTEKPSAAEGETTLTEEATQPLRLQKSEQARHENIDRLHQVRNQLHDDLMGTLAWVRELVTMIHLAKFTGAPASRAEELVAQIAAAVEGLSEVNSWRDEPVAV